MSEVGDPVGLGRRVPDQRTVEGGGPRQDVSLAQLTAKADLVLAELVGVIEAMAVLLRQGAHDER